MDFFRWIDDLLKQVASFEPYGDFREIWAEGFTLAFDRVASAASRLFIDLFAVGDGSLIQVLGHIAEVVVFPLLDETTA